MFLNFYLNIKKIIKKRKIYFDFEGDKILLSICIWSIFLLVGGFFGQTKINIGFTNEANKLQETALQVLIGFSAIVFSLSIFIFRLTSDINDFLGKKLFLKKSKIKFLLSFVICSYFAVLIIPNSIPIILGLLFTAILIIFSLFNILQTVKNYTRFEEERNDLLNKYIDKHLAKNEIIRKGRKEFDSFLEENNLEDYFIDRDYFFKDAEKKEKAKKCGVIEDLEYEEIKEKIEENVPDIKQNDEINSTYTNSDFEIYITKKKYEYVAKKDVIVKIYSQKSNKDLNLSQFIKIKPKTKDVGLIEEILYPYGDNILENVNEHKSFYFKRKIEELSNLLNKAKDERFSTEDREKLKEFIAKLLNGAIISFINNNNLKSLDDLVEFFDSLEELILEDSSEFFIDLYQEIIKDIYNILIFKKNNYRLKNHIQDFCFRPIVFSKKLIPFKKNDLLFRRVYSLMIDMIYDLATVKEAGKNLEFYKQFKFYERKLKDKIKITYGRKDIKNIKTTILADYLFKIYENHIQKKYCSDFQKNIFKDLIDSNVDKLFLETIEDNLFDYYRRDIERINKPARKTSVFYEFYFGLLFWVKNTNKEKIKKSEDTNHKVKSKRLEKFVKHYKPIKEALKKIKEKLNDGSKVKEYPFGLFPFNKEEVIKIIKEIDHLKQKEEENNKQKRMEKERSEELSKQKINSFKKEIEKEIDKTESVKKIFREKDICESKEIIYGSDKKWFGAYRIERRSLFLDMDKSFIGFEKHYARGIVEGENREILRKISKKAKVVNFSFLKKKLEKNSSKFLIIALGDGVLKLEKEFGIQIKKDEGVISEYKDTPIHRFFGPLGNKIILINKEKLGKLTQYEIKNNDESNFKSVFGENSEYYLEIQDLKLDENKELRDKIKQNKKEWIKNQKKEGDTDNDQVLKRHVVVKLFEKFEYNDDNLMAWKISFD